MVSNIELCVSSTGRISNLKIQFFIILSTTFKSHPQHASSYRTMVASKENHVSAMLHNVDGAIFTNVYDVIYPFEFFSIFIMKYILYILYHNWCKHLCQEPPDE